MSNYNIFSLFYDRFTENVNYQERTKYILEIFSRFDRKPSLLLDLACGTGNFSICFANNGIDVIGVDQSEDMLSVAQEKNDGLTCPVFYLCQKAEDLELFGTVDGAVCLLDSLNHITDYDCFKTAISKTALFLEPQCLFIFDLNTVYKHQKTLGNNSFRIKKGNVTCYWSNSYNKNDNSVKIQLQFVQKEGFLKKSYYCEEFLERAYTEQEILSAIKDAGLELLAVYGENTFKPPEEYSNRNIYVTRRVNNG